jgi:hypothetical protein
MARLSIYVTDELKARMDDVGDDVNWSEVVRPAIQSAIAIHQQRRSPSMTNAVERLRASKQEAEREDSEAGKAAGRHWAQHHASYKELRRVSEIDPNPSDENADWTNLKGAIDPDDELDHRGFLCEIGLDEQGEEVSGKYLAGFIEGAKEFFDEVKHKL